jgi:pyridoxal phosphate enzyme (YggS family)
MGIPDNLSQILKELPASVKLVIVSKMVQPDIIMEAYLAGQRSFGENRAQELLAKYPALPGDIQWHFLGHLQTNKVRYIAPFVSMIQSVDSLKLLQEINKEAIKNNRVIPCLLQFHIATEETKFGLDLKEAEELLSFPGFKEIKNIQVEGVMGMATFTDNENLIRKEFRDLRNYFLTLKQMFFRDDEHFREISMGMSGDYRIAMEEGSTIVRIGTAIFGER